MRLASTLSAALTALATAGLAAAQNDECTTALALPFNTLTAFDTSAPP